MMEDIHESEIAKAKSKAVNEHRPSAKHVECFGWNLIPARPFVYQNQLGWPGPHDLSATSLPPQVKVDLAPAVLAAAEADAAASAAAIAEVGESAAEEAMVGAEEEVAALEPVADAAPVGDGAAAAAAPVDDAVAADGMVGL